MTTKGCCGALATPDPGHASDRHRLTRAIDSQEGHVQSPPRRGRCSGAFGEFGKEGGRWGEETGVSGQTFNVTRDVPGLTHLQVVGIKHSLRPSARHMTCDSDHVALWLLVHAARDIGHTSDAARPTKSARTQGECAEIPNLRPLSNSPRNGKSKEKSTACPVSIRYSQVHFRT